MELQVQIFKIRLNGKVSGRSMLTVTGRVLVEQRGRSSYSCEVSGRDHLVIGLSDTAEGAVVEVMQMLIPIALDALMAGGQDFPSIEGIQWMPDARISSLPPSEARKLWSTPTWDEALSAVPA